MRNASLKAALLVLVLVASLLATDAVSRAISGSTDGSDPGPSPGRPNVVLITTDDQNLDDLAHMPRTLDLLAGHGVEFTRAVSPHPLCCPARAQMLTGQYGQNNGVHHNGGGYGGYQALRDPSNTIAAWLSEAGYATAMVGKYLNGYGRSTPAPAGWTHWTPTVAGAYDYRSATFLDDGAPVVRHGHTDDVIADYAVGYLEQMAAGNRPFFLWASHLAPHRRKNDGTSSWPLPAPRHRGSFTSGPAPSTTKPSYRDRGAGLGKGRQSQHRSAGRNRAAAEQVPFARRIESLQSVDESVARIVATLRASGELDNTYILFASDNGLLMGEHHLGGKNVLYREALEIPLVVRVPGRRQPSRSSLPVTVVDLAPTIADIAGVRPRREQDGASFLPTLHGRGQEWRDTQLIQTGTHRRSPEPGWEKRGVRTRRYAYWVDPRTGAEELYDHVRDPYEIDNVADRRAYRLVRAELRARTRVLKVCAGASCRRTFGPVPGVGTRR